MATIISETKINNNNNNVESININMSNNANNNNNSDEDEKHYTYAYQLVFCSALPMVMKAINDMGILKLIHDHVGPNGLSPAEIVAMLEIRNPNAAAMIDRMLRLLATYSVVWCSAVAAANDGGLERRYSCSPVTKFLVPHDDRVTPLATFLNFFDISNFHQSWGKLEEATLEGGIPFNMAYGMGIFEYASVDIKFNKVLNKAMHETTTFAINKILGKYNGLMNIQQVVDVGGGFGNTLHAITSKYPSIKGINFDLSHVIVNAPPIPGVEHVSGDMFKSIPKGDAILLKWVLHDWDEEHCVKLLKSCYKALPENGKVIVVEAVMADEAENTHLGRAVSLMDVLMMTHTRGGKERSRHEFEALAKKAGFSGINYDCCAYTCWVMEFYK